LRHAGFRVLQAPDVPSVLVEMGYLSNPEDEKLLNDEKWRESTAQLLAQSVQNYREMILAGRQ
jgi:N-acetylmuramoyl-L-alanine amidase